jgi:hypothetical protein
MKKQTMKPGWAIPITVFGSVFVLASACTTDPINPEDVACPTDSMGSSMTNEGGGDAVGGSTASSMNTGGSGTSGQAFTTQEISAKLHGCRKLRFESLGSLLQDRGVDLATLGGSQNNCQNDANGPSCGAGEQCFCPVPPCVEVGNEAGNQGMCVESPATPGFLFQSAGDAFAFPEVDSRVGEKDGHTTASATRLFDIFIQAAPQIIANIEDPQKAPACVLQGATNPMFDPTDGTCVEESVSCITGLPATDDHLLLCNLILEKADPNDPVDVMKKQHIAVAAIMSAAHSCE